MKSCAEFAIGGECHTGLFSWGRCEVGCMKITPQDSGRLKPECLLADLSKGTNGRLRAVLAPKGDLSSSSLPTKQSRAEKLQGINGCSHVKCIDMKDVKRFAIP